MQDVGHEAVQGPHRGLSTSEARQGGICLRYSSLIHSKYRRVGSYGRGMVVCHAEAQHAYKLEA